MGSRATAAAFLLILCGCGRLWELPRQIEGVKNLVWLAKSVEESPPLSGKEILELADSKGLLNDPWGNELVAIGADQHDGIEYLLIYPARDGQVDREEIESYFGLGPANVTGIWDHDLIVCNGKALTVVSKDPLPGIPNGPLPTTAPDS